LTWFDYVTLSLSRNWLCCYNLIMLLNFQCLWLCYIFSIIHHIIIICGVSGWKLYFIVFYVYKVGVGFTSPSEPMRHPFRNNAPHIKLWGASFSNYPTYFRQPENGDWRGYAAEIGHVIGEHWYWACDQRTSGYVVKIMNGRYMRASVTR
jgi:hypothetical protein